MQGEQPMSGESGFITTMKGVSSWLVTVIATSIEKIDMNKIAVGLSIIYTTLLIVSWFKREFRSAPRQIRVTDAAETIHAKKAVVLVDELEVPEVPGRKEQ